MAEEWYYSKNSERRGPVDMATLEALASTGVLTQTDLVWKEGMAAWQPAGSVPGIFKGPPPLPNSTHPGAPPLPPTSAVTNRPAMSFFNCSPLSPKLVFIFSAAALICFAIGNLTVFLAYITHVEALLIGGLVFSLPGLGLAVTASVFSLILFFRFWNCVPAEKRPFTPAKAVVFLFIPIFNFYWVFRAVRGLSVCTKDMLRARGSQADAPVGLATALCIVSIVSSVLSFVPFLSTLPDAALIALGCIWLYQQADATAELVGAPSSRGETRPWLITCLAATGLLMLMTLAATAAQLGQNASQPAQTYSSQTIPSVGQPSHFATPWGGGYKRFSNSKTDDSLQGALNRENQRKQDDLMLNGVPPPKPRDW